MGKKNRIIGIDFGATFIKAGLIDLNGRILKKTYFSTKAHKTSRKLIEKIVEEAKLLIGTKKGSILGVGVGVPGQVDFNKGIIYNLTNVKGWKYIPLRDILKKKLKLPVAVDNDAHAACMGEAEWGAAKGAKDIVCITLGSGVGGGIIIDGNLYRGRGYSAGEIGHLCIQRDGGIRCNCGGNGCMETFVGNSYIVKEVIRRLKKGERSILLKLAGGKYSEITPRLLDKAAKRGDRFAIKIWQDVGLSIGVGLVSVVNILNPEIIVIGGGVSRTGRILFDSIRKTVNMRAIDIFTKDLKIKRAKFIEDAGTVGAAALVKTVISNR